MESYCYYADVTRDAQWREIVGRAVKKCDKFVLFHGREIGQTQREEIDYFLNEHRNDFGQNALYVAFANARECPDNLFQLSKISIDAGVGNLDGNTLTYEQEERFEGEAERCAKEIFVRFCHANRTCRWIPTDDLPIGYPFSYEKEIIEEFVRGKGRLLTDKYLSEGCPIKWPRINKIGEPSITNPIPVEERGKDRIDGEDNIIVDVRGRYHAEVNGHKHCLSDLNLTFAEAGPRGKLFFPENNQALKVGIVVSGGIAPGINSVIAGIVQRHFRYHEKSMQRYNLEIFMFRDGFDGIDRLRMHKLNEKIARDQSTLGGSTISTSRYDDLLEIKNRDMREGLLADLVRKLAFARIDILYVIGGDGSMKAAHAIWTRAQEMFHSNDVDRKINKQISVVAIPKTMDNDVLWVWQSFGFLSAVEKAKECIVQLNTEAKSNPRLCIVQLFGSDSGFVVSHAALASGACMAALIPEVNFTMRELSANVTKRMQQKYRDKDRPENEGQSPYGIVLLGETAIPQDVEDYIDNQDYPDLGLEESEKDAIRRFMNSSLLCLKDILNWEDLANELNNAPDRSPAGHIVKLLIPEARVMLKHISNSSSKLKALIVFALNKVLKSPKFHHPVYFKDKEFSTELVEVKDISDQLESMIETGSPDFDGEDIKSLVQKLRTVSVSFEAKEIVKLLVRKSRQVNNWRSIPRQGNMALLQRLNKRLIEKFNRLLLEWLLPEKIIARSTSIQKERRVHGQTPDELRNGGLKIVSRVLKKDIRSIIDPEKYWCNYRVFVNEPRHLIRAIAPSVSDVISAQRLGILAVDNAMGGYTDFMVSQWLTEYVLVPLKLAVLGRKRVPPNGIFWKSVLACTGQKPEMEV